MAREEFLRTSVRLRIDQGVVLLRHGGVPSVACPLMDLSEGGCRCIAPMPALDAQTAGTWRQVLQVKRHLNIEISCPPHLVHFMIQAEVRRADPMADGGVELGLQFLNLAAQQKGSLQRPCSRSRPTRSAGPSRPQT
ncbi:MAG: PilZ domain-containing protein [Planctomycetota bacterium]|nr:PilZ domain-containing protein [Planctomycetota bacterium]